ncbi:long-chain-fatty-acid--CoA ligase [Embleya sp. NBC_00896]|uniref:long-chain-fatty-acid--CoA ligase n=1 Tax=Embleya sp. NBC_00896 TaxID=2975961 RepID=UPI0038667AD2|nr:long-chain-fatty-acid--CoA ligase [Embleya sp. NBC_00896]
MSGRWSMTLDELLRRRAEDTSVGLRHEDRAWSWAEVVAESARRAAFLRSLRVEGKPWHIGVMLENVPEFPLLLGAAALSGAVIVGLNPTRVGAELARDIDHTDCAIVITDAAHLAQLRTAAPDFPADRLLCVDDASWAESLAPFEGAAPPAERPGAEDTFMLILTSGTTGHPKAVICSQGKVASQGASVVAMERLTGVDVAYCAMPLFHSNAVITCWAPVLASGAELVVRRRFSASGFLPDVRRFGVTYANYVGKPLSYILATPELPDDADNPLTRVFGNEGGPQDVERFARRFGCTVRDGFGSTEGGLSFVPVPDMPPGALGKPNGDIRILNPDTREECPPAAFDAEGRLTNAEEAVGELVNVGGAGAFEGYYNNPTATAQRMREGWYWSGDLAFRTADDLVFFAGRSGEWIRVGGENFGSTPVARILSRHPDIAVATVYGVADEAAGDQAMAAFVLREGAAFDPAGFAAWLETQPDLSRSWHPRYVRIAGALPQTSTNKILTRVLIRQAWYTDPDALWWRDTKDGPYRPFTEADRKTLESAFADRGRGHILALMER